MTALEEWAFRQAAESFIRQTMYSKAVNTWSHLREFLETFQSLSRIPSDKELEDMWMYIVFQGDMQVYERFRLIMAQKAEEPKPLIVEAAK